MKPIIFVKTRHEYGSYYHYHRLIDLEGFETCYPDQIDYSRECCYILTPLNGEVYDSGAWPIHEREKHKEKRCRIIWWYLERPHDVSVVMGIADHPFFDWVWCIDKYMLRQCKPHPKFDYIKMGSHPGLATGPTDVKEYDLNIMMYENERRHPYIKALFESGITIAPRAYGADNNTLHMCRVLPYVHQDELLYLPPIRLCVAAANRCAVVGERVMVERTGYVPGKDLGFLSDAINISCRSGMWEQFADAMHTDLCVVDTFRKNIEEKIEEYEEDQVLDTRT